MYIACMVEIGFTWDEKKSRENRQKHGVSFEEATTAFYDPNALQFFDPDHSRDEDRFILFGISYKLRTLAVCHCYRENESVIRIISSRKANKKEAQSYGR